MVRYQDLGSAGLLPTSMERDRQAEGERQRDRGTWDQTGLLPSLWRETDGQSGGGGSKRKREGGYIRLERTGKHSRDTFEM